MKKIDQGIILKRSNYSDTSVILTILTRQGGLQKFIFQGGKKKAAVIYPLSTVEFAYFRRPDSELGKLTSADTLFPSSSIPFDPIRSSIAFYLADVILQTCKTEEQDEPLYEQALSLVLRLEEGEELPMLPVFALMELSHHLGIQPQVTGEEPVYLVLDEGEFRSVAPPGALTETGEHIHLLADLALRRSGIRADHQVRLRALMTLVRY